MPSERKSAFGNADDFGACMKKEDASVLRSGPQAASSCVVALISLASWLRSLTNLTTPFSLSFTTGPVAVSGGDTHRPKREMKYHARAMSPVLFSCGVRKTGSNLNLWCPQKGLEQQWACRWFAYDTKQ